MSLLIGPGSGPQWSPPTSIEQSDGRFTLGVWASQGSIDSALATSEQSLIRYAAEKVAARARAASGGCIPPSPPEPGVDPMTGEAPTDDPPSPNRVFLFARSAIVARVTHVEPGITVSVDPRPSALVCVQPLEDLDASGRI